MGGEGGGGAGEGFLPMRADESSVKSMTYDLGAWVQVLAPPLTTLVTLGKSHNLSASLSVRRE